MRAASEFASNFAFDSQVPSIALLLDFQTLQDPLANRQLCKRQTEHFSLKQSCKPTILRWLAGTLMNRHIFRADFAELHRNPSIFSNAETLA